MSQPTKHDLQKVDSVWFDDGNLIVIAEPKVFRLYQGFLARRSPIFRDMLSIPQPDTPTVLDGADRKVIDTLGLDCTGCAVVRFQDRPQDVEWFLSAFIHDSHLAQYSTNTSALTGILRLAAKYELTFLRRWTVHRLEELYPFAVDVDTDGLLQRLRRKEDGSGYLEWMDGMLPLITVALAVGVPWVLPQVLWALQTVSMRYLLQHPEWAALPEEQKTSYLLGRDAANNMAFGAFTIVLDLHRQGTVHGPMPTAGEDCEEAFRRTLHELVANRGPDAIKDQSWIKYVDESGCVECKKMYIVKRRYMIEVRYLTLQQCNGLPAPTKMMELREAYHREE